MLTICKTVYDFILTSLLLFPDLYSVLPPLESFMDVNGFTRRENFYKVKFVFIIIIDIYHLGLNKEQSCSSACKIVCEVNFVCFLEKGAGLHLQGFDPILTYTEMVHSLPHSCLLSGPEVHDV